MSLADDVAHLEAGIVEAIADRDRALGKLNQMRHLLAGRELTALGRVRLHAVCLIDSLGEVAAEKPDSSLARKFDAWAVVLEYVANEAKRILGREG